MTDERGRRFRRLRAVPPVDAPETAESVLPDLPRVGALDALLREVDSLRLTLETDLTLAASAVEAGAPQIAADIIDSDREGLRAFEERALGHVADLAAPLPAKRRFRVPAAPFVAAAAVAGFLLGVVPHTQPPATDSTFAPSSLASPAESLDRLQEAAAKGQTTVAISAAEQLHAQLQQIVSNGSSNMADVQHALDLLDQERNALALTGSDSLQVKQLLAESRVLYNQLVKTLPPAIAAKLSPSVPPVPAVASPRPQTSASPKPATSSSPKAQPKPSSSPKQGSSPNPSSSPTSPTLPGAPGLN